MWDPHTQVKQIIYFEFWNFFDSYYGTVVFLILQMLLLFSWCWARFKMDQIFLWLFILVVDVGAVFAIDVGGVRRTSVTAKGTTSAFCLLWYVYIYVSSMLLLKVLNGSYRDIPIFKSCCAYFIKKLIQYPFRVSYRAVIPQIESCLNLLAHRILYRLKLTFSHSCTQD